MDIYRVDQQLVSLPVAAATIYARLTGYVVSGERDARTLSLLNDVAHALSNVVPIWISRDDGTYRQLDAFELLEARFERGAMRLKKKDGEQLLRLAVKRGDMLLAIKVLRGAGASFR